MIGCMLTLICCRNQRLYYISDILKVLDGSVNVVYIDILVAHLTNFLMEHVVKIIVLFFTDKKLANSYK